MNRLGEALRSFFDSEYLNPHGICLLWRPELIWTHAVSDTVIGLAYFSIPAALAVFLYHRRDVRFGWAIWMFFFFIMLCGVTHFMSVLTLWRPYYGVEALLKAATAIASVITAVALWPLLPKVIAIPSNEALQARIAERDEALKDLRAAMGAMLEMREHERRQRLLLDELNHRVKNTLASVQSIAMQTFGSARDGGENNETFMRRLMALSSTHDVIVRREWESARLSELIDATLAHYARPFDLAGPDLFLSPNAAVTVGLALHELCTNSVKYGAWSGSGGVTVSVEISDHGLIKIVWREVGGPAVEEPIRRGFGTRLLRQGVARELGGTVSLDYRPTGLVCTVVVPSSEKVRLTEPTAAKRVDLER